MISQQFIREHPEAVREALSKRGATGPIDDILELDRQRRKTLVEMETLRAQQNKASKEIGQVLGEARKHAAPADEPDDRLTPEQKTARASLDRAEHLKAELAQVSDRIKTLDAQVKDIDAKLETLLLQIPNMPDPSVPVGPDSSGNRVVRTWGEQPVFDFKPKPHWELGEKLGIIDFERGVKVSGSRFYILKGKGAKLQRALISWMLDLHTREHGYTEIYPPFLVKEMCLVGSGNLPKFGENLYRDAEEDLWLVPTAEVPLTNLHRDEILDAAMLPLSYVAYTACFRREKVSAGTDVRGIKRVHQFDKIELYKLVEPSRTPEALQALLADAESVARGLGLPYHIVELCTGDLGFQSAKSFDVEIWSPGCGEWLEVSSCSACGDFQAHRANLRYRPNPKAKPEFVHTLNGSGLALPRVMIALLENCQQADGSVRVPDVLRPYTGFDSIP